MRKEAGTRRMKAAKNGMKKARKTAFELVDMGPSGRKDSADAPCGWNQ